ncbi:protein-lysine N-methyltransferase EEF2KMT-like [Ptychodera flava]|uniref:protein-lysine N-methyltransferase EEF2KMT-like n=1 Tax=Ptychodera flava TaxID=63121 RepID=UPI003969CBF5
MAAGKEDSWVYSIVAQYFATLPLRNFKWKLSPSGLGLEAQKKILDQTINSKLNKDFPPSRSYQKKFIKSLMQKCEESECEIFEDIYTIYADLVSIEQDTDVCYKTYFLPNGSSVCIQETNSVISHGTTGLCTWPASLYMTEWILANSTIFNGKKVLELGSGCGLLGLALCKSCQPKHFYFSDMHRLVLKSLLDNIVINFGEKSEHCLCSNGEGDKGMSSDSYQEQNRLCVRKDCCVSHRESDIDKTTLAKSDSVGSTSFDIHDCKGSDQSDADIGSHTVQEESEALSSMEQTQGHHQELKDELESGHRNPIGHDQGINQGNTLPLNKTNGTDEDSGFLYTSDKVSILTLDWEHVTREELEQISPDIVIAADVVFDPSIVPHLVNVLNIILSHSNPARSPVTAYVASTIRSEDTFHHFLAELGNQLISVEFLEEEFEEVFFYDKTCPIKLIKLTRKP